MSKIIAFYNTEYYIFKGTEVRIFKTKGFTRFARKQRIDDFALSDAVARAEQGLVEADLGGGLIKQRIARRGQGRSGGYRTIIAYARGDRAVFIFGFAKNERDDVADDELASLKELAAALLATGDIDRLLQVEGIEEVA